MANLRFNNWPLRLLKVYSREGNLLEHFTTMFTSYTSLCLELYDWFLSLTFFFSQQVSIILKTFLKYGLHENG